MRKLIGNAIGENLGTRPRGEHRVLIRVAVAGRSRFDRSQNVGSLFVFMLDAGVNFFAVNSNVWRRLDSDLNPAGADRYDRKLDAWMKPAGEVPAVLPH